MTDKINADNKMPFDIEAFSQLPCVLQKEHKDFREPTPLEVKALRSYLGLSQTACARFLGVPYKADKGSNTVRKWETSEDSPNFRAIPYASWRLLLVASEIVDVQDDINLVTQARSDCF